MNAKLFFVFLFIQASCFGQTGYIEIKGKVFSHPAPFYEKKDTIYINNVEVILKIKDSVELKTVTDDNGNYTFRIPKVNKEGILFTRAGKYSGSNIKHMDGFFSGQDITTVNLQGQDKIINFYVAAILVCGWEFPTFLFDKNNKRPGSAFVYETMKVDTALMQIYRHLSKRYYLVIELNGNCDAAETNKDTLSLERARVIKQMIVATGIDEARISVNGYGSKYPLSQTPDYGGYKKLVFPKNALNRRVSFNVISFDYGSKK